LVYFKLKEKSTVIVISKKTWVIYFNTLASSRNQGFSRQNNWITHGFARA